MPKANFTLEVDSSESTKRRRGVRCSPFALFLLTLVLVSAVAVIIVLSVFFVQQNEDILDLQNQINRINASTPVIVPPTSPPQTIWPNYRLPSDLIPSHYDLNLQVFLPYTDAEADRPNAFTTRGTVSVEFECVAETDLLVLHSWDIDIRVKHLQNATHTVPLQRQIVYDPVRHLVIMRADERLVRGGKYTLMMEYEGQIVGENQGFYRSFYEINGEKRWLATTQFQPYKARRAFPCFDEPSFRATFDITIKHDSRHTGTYSVRRITNTTHLVDGWTETTFERTVRMPTYLLAFIVSDFARNNTAMEDGVDFGVISRPDAIEDASLALRTGVNMTTFVGRDLFDMPYKDYNSKLDMAAVPDFDAGAMENWGLIIYREVYMLHRVGITSAEDKKQIVRIVAHELAHMWFGNAVTCSWWSESFLNEGFATFMEYPLTHHAKPEWNIPTLFTATDTRVAYDTDSYESSIPLFREVNTQAEISDMFGRITYQKGGAVIRMMEGVMGTSDLYAALKSYLHRMRNDSITTYPDLLRALTDHLVGKPHFANITERFDKWITTSGFPLVTIRRNGNTLSLSQERFLLGNSSENATRQIWHVPISYVTSLDAITEENRVQLIRPKLWLENKTAEHTLTGENISWILANVEHYGYYRVNYDSDNWDKLTEQLKTNHQVISVYSRTQLIDDSFNLARKGALNYTVPFKILSSYMQRENAYAPWYAALDNLQYLDIMMGTQEAFKNYTSALFQHHYSADFWNTSTVWRDEEHEDYQELMLNRLFVEQSCYYEHQGCEEHARQEFVKWQADPANKPVDPHLRDQVFCYGMRNNATNDTDFDFMLQQYRAAEVHNVKLAVLRGLACSRQQAMIERLLNLSLDTTIIRSQDQAYVFRYLVKFFLGTETAWKFLRENWNAFSKSLSRNDMVTSVCTKFDTPAQLAEVEAFYASLGPNIEEKLAFESAITKIKANIEWLRTYQQSVLDALVTAEAP